MYVSNRRRLWWRSLVVPSVLALVLAACGGGDDGETGDDTEAETTEGETTEAAAGETTTAEEGGSETTEAEEAAGGEDWPEELVFAAVPSEEATELVDSWQPMLDALSERLGGIPIEFVSATDYAAVVEAQVAERAAIAFYGPFGYVVARNAGADIEALVAQIDSEGEPPGYQSYLVTTPDRDDISEVADLEGKTVCLVDPTSTSGGLYPMAMMLDAGLDPDTDLTATYTGAHDASVLAMLSGDCEAAFAFDTMVDRVLPERGEYEEGDVKIVDKSVVIPGSPIAAGNWLPDDLKTAIQEALVEINAEVLNEEGLCPDDRVVEEEGVSMCRIGDEARWGAESVDDAYYDGIREVCELTQAPACEGE
ncbi:MAG: phosphate/phosphite/phosphonate ABC transporter substrate-binding protein [Acidimicrobiia bacterium]|nr:phosphate/phosphite/phosphonate ABC transporter substrate-binding protein [Acidimicrobiia bacterium]